VFCSNQLGNSPQIDLSGLGIDVKLKEKKERKENTSQSNIFQKSSYKNRPITLGPRQGHKVQHL
jgi:hypothetical protein